MSVSPLRAARFATQAHFFVCGLLFAAWGVHIPSVKLAYDVSEMQLALLMLCAGLGALFGLSRVGGWVGRHGARPVILLNGLVMAVGLGVLLHMPNVWTLGAILFFFGIANGAFDVAMNAEAVAVERAMGRPVMSSFHGFFSLGGMTGALCGSVAFKLGMAPATQLASFAALGFAVIYCASRYMLPTEATHSPDRAHHRFSMPRGTILLLGLLAALGLLGEGAMYDWSTLYMAKDLGSAPAVAALAYGAFSGAMAVARFCGDRLRARWGARLTLVVSAWMAAVAMTAGLVAHSPSAAIVAFALVGFGFANVIPVLFSAAARVPGVAPAQGIAGVSSIGYLGFMVGPPLIGFVAESTSLSTALFAVAAFAGAVALLAPRAIAPEVSTKHD